jgi:hypothetical protein
MGQWVLYETTSKLFKRQQGLREFCIRAGLIVGAVAN